MRAWFSFLAACASVFLSGCPKAPPPPSPPPPPAAAPTAPSPRIVSLSPAVSVILRDLGHEPEVVGRHAYDFVLASGVPVCGDQSGIDYESLVRTKPTHVFTQWGSRALPERLRTMAAEQKWTLRDVPILTLDDIGAAVATVDRAARNAGEDDPLSSLAKQLQSGLMELSHPTTTPDRSSAGKVLLLISTAPPTALGPGSAHDELLRAIGAVPALADGKAYAELTHEDLVRLAPEAIILFLPRAANSAAAPSTEAGGTPANDPWKPLRELNLPALRSNHVAVIDDPLALLPSTGLIPVGEKMKTLLSQWEKK